MYCHPQIYYVGDIYTVAESKRGWTPLHYAASSDVSSDRLNVLLTDTSADVNAQTFQGATPIFIATENGCLKAVEMLLKDPECNVNLANSDDIHPIQVACRQGNLRIVKLLVEFGADVNARDCFSYTPLHQAVLFRSRTWEQQDEISREQRDQISSQICQFLLNHNANPDVFGMEGSHPFHVACQNGLLKSLNLLFEFSKLHDLINLPDKLGRTPLILAVKSGNLSVVEALLSRGANPNVADMFKYTPLFLAVETANFELFSLIHKATCNEFILKYCTFDEARDYEEILSKRKAFNSIIISAINTGNLSFLVKILESNVDPSVLKCPVKDVVKCDISLPVNIIFLQTPISYLLLRKMSHLGERTIDFLSALISHGSPLQVTSKHVFINYNDPICICLDALGDCPVNIVMKCLRILLDHGADPDYPHGKVPIAISKTIERNCVEAALLLLQFSNFLEPEDVIKCIEQENRAVGVNIVEGFLPLAPYYTPSDTILAGFMDNSRRKALLAPKVYSLASYCRTVVRKQIRQASKSSPLTFRQRLFDLPLPKEICLFLSFM